MIQTALRTVLCCSMLALLSCAPGQHKEGRNDSRAALVIPVVEDIEQVGADRLYSDIDDSILVNFKQVEGHTHQNPEREACLAELAQDDRIENIAEIGFNAGHSAVTFLYHNRSAHLWSFDLCDHPYCTPCADYVGGVFAGRFTLICGDSRKTVPQFIEDNPDTKFDLIHIDGGHVASIPLADMMNMLELSHEDTIIVADDCNENQEVAGGGFAAPEVNLVWRFAVRHQIIEPLDLGDHCNFGNCVGRPFPRDRRDEP